MYLSNDAIIVTIDFCFPHQLIDNFFSKMKFAERERERDKERGDNGRILLEKTVLILIKGKGHNRNSDYFRGNEMEGKLASRLRLERDGAFRKNTYQVKRPRA